MENSQFFKSKSKTFTLKRGGGVKEKYKEEGEKKILLSTFCWNSEILVDIRFFFFCLFFNKTPYCYHGVKYRLKWLKVFVKSFFKSIFSLLIVRYLFYLKMKLFHFFMSPLRFRNRLSFLKSAFIHSISFIITIRLRLFTVLSPASSNVSCEIQLNVFLSPVPNEVFYF